MSTTIDEKVVEMRFDNKDFEKNVKASIDTLGDLKKSLNFEDTAKSFNNLEKATKGVKFDGLYNAVDTVKHKFSAMEVIAVTALANITNSAVNAGKRIVKSLTVEPISQGFNEYELKMNSVQTIMSSTGESLATVNKYLEELNKYADRTIYSFSDMTANIGKFTNSGVKLEDAVKAIQGVSNVAAVSGANTNEASRAMYNFAQALSSGAVKLIDWKSIENANMATVEFKQNLIDTAVALGTVKKNGDSYVALTSGNTTKKTKEAFTATSKFNDALSDQWMTTEVLVQTLSNYSTDIREMSEQEIKAYEEKLKGIGYTEEQIKAIEELGKKAFDAAQDVKTFTQLLDTLKEAAGSGWAQSFELLFGDFNEAKKLWTAVSNEIGGLIDSVSKRRNELLKGWKQFGGRTQLFEGIANIYNNLKNIFTAIKKGVEDILPPFTVATLLKITKAFKNLTEALMANQEVLDKLRRIARGAAAVFDIFKQLFTAVWNGVKQAFGTVDSFSSKLLEGAATLGDWLVALRNWIKENDIFNKGVAKVVEGVRYIANGIGYLHNKLVEAGVIDAIKNFNKAVKDLVVNLFQGKGFKESFKQFFESIFNAGDGTNKVLTFFKKIGNDIKTAWAGISDTFNSKVKPGFQKFKEALNNAWEGVVEAYTKAKDKIKIAWDKIKEVISEATGVDLSGLMTFSKALKIIFSPIQIIFTAIGHVFSGFGWLLENFGPTIINLLSKVGNSIVKFAKAVGNAMKNGNYAKIFDMFTSGTMAIVFAKLAKLLLGLKGIGKAAKELGDDGSGGFSLIKFFKGLKDGAKGIWESISPLLEGVKGILTAWQKDLKANVLLKIAAAIGILAVSLTILSDLDQERLITSLGAITALFGELVAAFKIISGAMTVENSVSGAKASIAGLTQVTAFVLSMAASVLIMALALKSLAKLDTKQLIMGLIGITVLLGEVVAVVKLLSTDQPKLMTGVKGLVSMAVAVYIMSMAVKKLAKLDPKAMIMGVAGIGMILTEIVAFIQILTRGFKGDTANMTRTMVSMKELAFSMVILGVAMSIMAGVVKKLAKMEPDKMIQGLAGFAAILLAVDAFTMYFKSPGKGEAGIMRMASMMLVLSIAMNLMATSMKIMGSMNFEQIANGLIGFIGAFATIVIAFDNLAGEGKRLVAMGGSMMMIGTAMVIIASAMKIMGSMDFESIGKAAVGFIGVFGFIVLALDAMKGEAKTALGMSGAMILFAVALTILAGAMAIVGNLNGGALVKSIAGIGMLLGILTLFMNFTDVSHALGVMGVLMAFATAITLLVPALMLLSVLKMSAILAIVIALGSVFAILAVSATAMQSLIGPLLAITGAVALLGVGIMALGAGVLFLAVGLTALAAAAPAVLNFLLIFCEGILIFIPKLVLSFFQSLISSILNFGSQLIIAILTVVNEVTPVLIETVFNIIDALLESLKKHLPNICNNLIDLFLKLVDILARRSFEIVDKLWNLVMDMIAALGQAFRKNIKKMVDTLVGLILDVLRGALSIVFPFLSDWLIGGLEDAEDEIEDFLTEEERKISDRVKEMKDDYEELDKSRKEEVEGIKNEYGHIQELVDEYNGLIDANGKIKTGYENRAETILTTLADAMGIERDEIDKLIDKNGKLGDSYVDVMTKMKAKAYLEANQSMYEESVKNVREAKEAYLTNLKGYNESSQTYKNAARLLANAEEREDRARALGDWDTVAREMKNVEELTKARDKAGERADQFLTDLNTSSDTYSKYLTNISNWEGQLNAIQKENISDMEYYIGMWDTGLMTSATATERALKQQEKELLEKRNQYRKLYASGDISKEELDEMEALYSRAMGEVVKIQNGITRDTHQSGKNMMNEAARGVNEGSTTLTTATTNAANSAVEPFEEMPDELHDLNLESLDLTEADMDKISEIYEKEGVDGVQAYVNSITSGTGKVTKATEKVEQAAVDGLKDGEKDMAEMGNHFINGLVNSVMSSANMSRVGEAAAASAKHFIEIYAKEGQVASPSKVMYRLGSFFMQGFVNGVNSLKKLVGITSEDMANTSIDTMTETLAAVSDIFGSDLDVDPTIRPVMDLTGITDGVNSMNRMLSIDKTIGLSSDVNRNTNAAIAANQNGLNINNGDVVRSIGLLREDLSTLKEKVGNLQVVMDTGALVGQIANPIDSALGRKTLYRGRGI